MLAVLAAPVALGQSDLTVTPAALSVTAPAGETATATLNLRNDGAAPLGFSLPQLAAPVPAGASAPDGYGYRWIDSDAPGGPVFDAEDISPQGNGLGTALAFGGSDFVTAALPFSFPFYGESYGSVRVYKDGFLTFDETPLTRPHNTHALPNPTPPNAVIAAFWDLVGYGATSRVYAATLPDGRFVVQYHRVYLIFPGSGEPNTIQVILSPDGEIEVQYLALDPVLPFSIGIENADGTEGHDIATSQYVHEGLAIRFFHRPPFLASAAPTAGTLAPGAAEDVAVTFSAEGLTAGTYASTLLIQSNDPDEANLYVPLTLTVTGESHLEVTPAAVDFGPTVVGEAERALVTLRNTGASTLQITDAAASGAGFGTTFAAPLTLGPGEEAAGTVTFAPGAPGAASGALTFTSNDPDAPMRTVPLSGEGIQAPALAWSPDALTATTTAGGTATTALTLENTGAGPLAFSFPGFEQQRLGGPDGFGHWWSDSDDPNGPAFDWIDISATATRVTLAAGSDHAVVDLPFAFPFYGEAKTEIGINGNGFLSFGEVGTGTAVSFSDPIPTAYIPNDLIAVFWDYLDPSYGEIYYQDLADGRFVVTWDGVPSYLDRFDPNTFQAVLYEDGTVLFQYLDIPSAYRDHVAVGVENATGTVGLEVAYREEYVEDGLAVRISTGLPLISAVTPASGTVPPGGTAAVTVAFDAGPLNGGSYPGVLKLRTNDPAQRHASIPATLVVEGEAGITVTPEALAFGPVVTGQTVTATVTLGNVGTEVLTVSQVSVPAPFGVSAGGPFTLAPGTTRTLTVGFAPTATGSFAEALTILSDDPMTPTRTVALSGEGIEAPAVVVSPEAIAAEAAVGEAVTATLTVENTGAGPLLYRFPQFSDSTGSGARGAGGPDGFGYRWADSDEPGGPAFDWIDISETGTLLDVTASGPYVPLPFTFFFYGEPYDEVGVFHGGFLAFEPFSSYYGARPIPNAFAPNGVIGVYWGNRSEGGEVHYATLADGRFVVQWTDIPNFGYPQGSTYTFQVILDRAHGLTFQYLEMGEPPEGNSLVVGIENADGTGGLPVAQSVPANNYDTSALPTDGLAVQITAPTAFLASAAPTAGTVAPGESAEVTLTLSAEGLLDGTYSGDLVITSNDPDRPRVDVPATLTVSGAAAIAASPAALDFGSLFVGNEAEAEVVVTNPGTEALVVSDVSVSGVGFSVAPAEGFTLAPFASDTLTVTFAPGSEGVQTGALALASDAPGTPVLEVPLAGEGAPPPVGSVSRETIPATVAQGTTASRTFTLTNTGGSPMRYTLRATPGGLALPELRPASARPTGPARAAEAARAAGPALSAEADNVLGRLRADAPGAARGAEVETVPLERAGPGDIVYIGEFDPPGEYGSPGDVTVTPDGTVYAADTREGWTVRYTPNLIETETFRHPQAGPRPRTRGLAYNEDTRTLWYLNTTYDNSTYFDYDLVLIEAGLDGVPTGRVVALPQPDNEQYEGLSYNERTGTFFALDTYHDDIYAFTPDGAIVEGYPVPQTSGDDGDAALYGNGLDAWGDYLDVPFGRDGISRVVVTDLAGEDAGPETPITDPDLEFAGRRVVRSRTQPNALMYTLGPGAVYAIAPAVRDDLKPFLRVTSDSTGTIAPGESVEVALLFDALDLPVDFFAKRIRIETDSPVTPVLVVTGQMSVNPPGTTPTEPGAVPAVFALAPSYPNPFSASTRIRYAVPAAGHVALRVHDSLGRLVATLVDDARPAGYHEAVWEADGAASGVYLVRMEAGTFARTQRVTVVR